jgi:lipid II:glycine glycyltransferase (peptidoglycan interpeptide bridge formation enzyme)
MDVKEITQKEVWESFLLECEEKTFLQSWNWGEFQKRMSSKIWRFGVFTGDIIEGVCLVSKISAKRGTYLLVQHGPVTKTAEWKIKDGKDKKILSALLEKLKEIEKQKKTSFIRISPIFPEIEENKKIFKDLKFRKAPMHANAYEATWKLDITPSQDDLMKNMRKTTRYLVRQAMKNPDISIEKSEKLNDADTYKSLNAEVAKRQNFTPFSDKYIENEFDLFSADGQACWFFGKYKNDLAAAALVVFWQGIGFYHQAASISKYSKLSIPYLLQWEAIKEAKGRGCKIYDFWGYADPQKFPKHPWAGPTLFKMGFGGYNKDYVKTQDFPLSKKYWIIYLFENLRKRRRGF